VTLQELRRLDAVWRADLADLLRLCEEADDFPSLAEPQAAALTGPLSPDDLTEIGTTVVVAEEGGSLIGLSVRTEGKDGSVSIHRVIHPQFRPGDSGRALRDALTKAALAAGDTSTGGAGAATRLWIMGAGPHDDEEAAALGFQPDREVVQLRVPLPLTSEVEAATTPLQTRSYRPGIDDEDWLRVNNRAFAGHPEQGDWTETQLETRLGAPWFEADGFLVADEAATADETAHMFGSCWTKIHRQRQPVLGEIYIISVDPDQHGKGLGRALTVAGLNYMAGMGVPIGMLYTDRTNTAALALYGKLGFTEHHADRAYRLNEDRFLWRDPPRR
jgi:mycothiol synthase